MQMEGFQQQPMKKKGDDQNNFWNLSTSLQHHPNLEELATFPFRIFTFVDFENSKYHPSLNAKKHILQLLLAF